MKRTAKSLASFTLALILLLALLPGNVFAAGDSIADATRAVFGRTYNGELTDTNAQDYYSFTLSSSGYVCITAIADIYKVYYYLYDANGDTLWYDYYTANDAGRSVNDLGFDLTKGTYYFCVKRYDPNSSTHYTGNYSISASFTSAGESFTETGYGTNNSLNSANSIALNRSYKGQIAYNDSSDFYSFTLSSSGYVYISTIAEIYKVYYYLYDANGDTLWYDSYTANSTGSSVKDLSFDLTKGTYYFCVKRYDPNSSTRYTGTYEFTVADSTPKAIANVTAAAAEGMITVNWTESENATAYIIQRRVKGEDSWKTLKSNVVGMSYEDATGTAGIAYQYRVRGCNEDKRGPFTVSNTVTAVPAAPAAPTITVTAAIGKNTVKWNAVSGATKYTVYRLVNTDGTWSKQELIATLKSGTSFADTNVTPGAKYRYRVRAYGAGGWSDYSNNVYVTAAAAAPAAPTITVTASAGKNTVKWNKVSGATKYAVYRLTYINGAWSKQETLGTVTGTSFTDTSVAAGTKYRYRVRAYGPGGWSGYSDSILVTTAPAAPTITVTVTAGKNTVKWDAVNGAAKYTVYRLTYINGTWSKQEPIGTVTGSSYTDKNVMSGIKYRYRVRAYGAGGWSDYSNNVYIIAK